MKIDSTISQGVAKEFDGIICFGGVDWWYHNRGHYDLQMMREFSKSTRVLYVNSIGMRAPKTTEGGMFFKRVIRKLKSIKNGLTHVRENYSVFSPLTVPGGGNGKFTALVAKLALSLQVKIAARRCGIKKPLVWVACPPAEPVLNSLKPVAVIYQRTDRFENFAGVNTDRIRQFDVSLKLKADLVLFCSRELYEAEKSQNQHSVFVDHGVDFDLFEKAGVESSSSSEPIEIRHIPHPRVGFVGGIDAHTFDPGLFVDVAEMLPHVEFILVGACSLPKDWCSLDNVHLLGQRPYEEVASYMASCDVLIMPWNQSDWIKACNPVKMKEYLAVGRPVVSTFFPEIQYFTDHIEVAITAEEFVEAIVRALESPEGDDERRDRVREQTWASKANIVGEFLYSTYIRAMPRTEKRTYDKAKS